MNANANAAARNELLARRFRAVRNITARLCDPLSAEDCAAQSMADASPAKWHLAHTTWFLETFVIKPALPNYKPHHPRFEVLFNSYYNAVGEQYSRPDRGLLTRPSFEEILEYRAVIETLVSELLNDPGRLSEEQMDVVELGLHHEQQHQELLLTDVKHLLSQNPLAPVYRPTKESPNLAIQSLAWHAERGGVVEVGHAGSSFGFDNEFPRHRVHLEPFELASRPIRNGEFIAFMEDGGYARPEFWLSEGWAQVQKAGWKAPLYWQYHDESWWHSRSQAFGLFEAKSLWPM